jgi:hypothetical protein
VVVNEGTKWPVDHGVLKVVRRSEAGDANPHVQPQPEMPGSPLDLLTISNQASRCPANSLFPGRCRRPEMKIDTAGEIKTSMNRCVDSCLQNDFRFPTFYLRLSAQICG